MSKGTYTIPIFQKAHCPRKETKGIEDKSPDSKSRAMVREPRDEFQGSARSPAL
jgi:hypothetical protein